MKHGSNGIFNRQTLVTVVLLAIFLATGFLQAQAQEPSVLTELDSSGDDSRSDEEGSTTSSQSDVVGPSANGLVFDVYTAGGPPRQGYASRIHANAEARSVGYWLRRAGWTWRWYFYETSWGAYAFRRGYENRYVDSSDLAFYVGHGSPQGIFMTPGFTRLYATQARYSWGDRRNKWIALTACQALSNSNIRNWFRTMRGTHLILGFVTNAAGSSSHSRTHGYWFSYYLAHGYNMTQAWFRASDRSQPRRTVARILATDRSCFYDTPARGRYCRGGLNSWYYWTRVVRSGNQALAAESVPPVSYEDVGGRMPVYRTPPLSLDESQNRFDNLGSTFDVPSIVIADNRTEQADEEPFQTSISSDNRELAMDPETGYYVYTDRDDLWSDEQIQQAAQPVVGRISSVDAKNIADSFLTSNDLMPEDARFGEVVGETLTESPIESTDIQLQQDADTLAWEVIYNRVLTYTPTLTTTTTLANTEPIAFEVVGPGAQQSVHVDATTALTSTSIAAIDNTVLGASGGWADVEDPINNVAAVEDVPVLTRQKIETLYAELGSQIALNSPPVESDGYNILGYSLTYWSGGPEANQDQLTPVYALDISFTLDGEEVLRDTIYVPANQSYMDPFARIETTLPEDVTVGDTVELTAADASSTLAELGFDSSLDFALGTGSELDYIYDWYVNEISDDTKIGSGRTISYQINADDFVESGENAEQMTIILQVTDIGSATQLSQTAVRSIQTGDAPRLNIYMPLVQQ